MATHPSSTVVGVFTDRSMAEQALQALHDAGVSDEQIRYFGAGSSGGLLEDIKSLFTGSTSNGDFSGLGLSDEEVRYYSNEYNKGNSVIAVMAPGHEEDVLSVLNRYSAYSYRNDPAAVTSTSGAPGNVAQSAAGADAASYASPHSFTATETPPAQYATDSTSADSYTTSRADQNIASPPPPAGSYSSTETATDNSTDSGTPLEASATDEYQHAATSSDDGYANAASIPTDSSVIDYEQTPLVDAGAANHPVTTANDVIAAPETEGDAVPLAESHAVTTSSSDTVPVVQSDAVAPSNSDVAATPTGDAFVNNDTTPVTDSQVVSGSNGAQATYTNEQDYNDVLARQQTDKLVGKDERGVQADQGAPALEGQQENDPDVYEARVQDAQSQLQDYQQQLRDARARLQAAKQREMQLQASHQRYQEVQTQLQGVQSELEATLAELKETQSRIDQYK